MLTIRVPGRAHLVVARLVFVCAVAGGGPLVAQSLPVRQTIVDTVVHGRTAQLTTQTFFVVGPDGEIALTPRLDQPVALYSGDSALTLFQPTKSPGDDAPFRVAGLGWVGDSVWIRVDGVATIYSRQGDPGRRIALELTVHGPPGSRPFAHEERGLIKRAPLEAIYPNGGLLMGEMAAWMLSSVPAAGVTNLYLRVSDRGAFVRTVGLGYSGDVQCRMPFYDFGSIVRPFCRLPRSQASPGGAMVASILATGDTRTVHVVMLRESGDTAWQRDLTLPTVPVLSRERDSAIADIGRRYAVSPVRGVADSAVRVVRHNPVAAHAPVVALLVGDDGSVWLDLYTRDHQHQWLVVHADGQVAGVATLPATTTLKEVRGDVAWGLDATGDVVNLLRYRLAPVNVPSGQGTFTSRTVPSSAGALAISATASLSAQTPVPDTLPPPAPIESSGIDGYQRHWPELRRACAAERSGTELARDAEALKIEGLVHRKYSDSLQQLLGCLRVINYVDGDQSVITFLSAGGKALDAWLTLGAHRAPDARSAEMVALLALDLPNGPSFGTGVMRSGVAQAAGQRQHVAEAMYRAVRGGASSPPVLRACVLYALGVGDAATARYCVDQALRLGVDSTWHLMQLSWLAARHADTAAAVTLLRAAIAAAHDRASEVEITRRLHRDADPSSPAFVNALLHDEARAGFVSPLLEYCPVWSEVNGARAQQAGECVGVHGRTEGALPVIGNLARLWDPATGQPIGIFTVTINDDRGPPGEGAPADVTLSLRQWDWAAALWHDSTVHPRLVAAGTRNHPELVAAVLAEPVIASGAWSIVMSSEDRLGRVSAEGGPPLSSDSFALSDVVVGARSQHLAIQFGPDSLTLAPFNTLAPSEPATLFYQIRSPSRQAKLRSVVTFRRISGGRVVPAPVLTLGAPASIAAGLTSVERDLDLSRLGRGDYQLEVRMIASDGHTLASRTTNLLLR